ncbi:MAG: hypothetical protein CMJ06_00855 [Pelagibacterales bacterium]|nr:hypothetical protein [Pelagibacterales bacterium]OUU63597.1 MAG: hypothetical protein CBC22_00825 [Alphaproteobacteria bacterium TMED62]|tara:strand:+ start:872 stop:1351 length:480 start_codon:yes stop_codon:yes gene_type:complete
MHYLIILVFFIITNILTAEDYIIEFQAKVENLKEFNISKYEKFRNYDLVGTFTDNYGNYGKANVIVISDVKDGKLLRLDATSENIYSNNERLYMRGIREKSDIDAGIAYNIVIGASKKFESLIGIKCTTSVRYFEDAIFGIQKCKLSQDMTSILKNSNN